jgi:hypothetical protein
MKKKTGDYSQKMVHVQRCEGFIKSRVEKGSNIDLIGSFKSYVTGLKFHKYVEKPSSDRIYLCLPNPDNKFDPLAIGVYANQSRIGFVPKDLCLHTKENFNLQDGSVAMLCYCTGNTTDVSSQCVYNIFKVSKDDLNFVGKITTNGDSKESSSMDHYSTEDKTSCMDTSP